MENKDSIIINLNFIFNTVTTNAELKETIVEQVLNLDHQEIIALTKQQLKGENNG